MNKLEYYSYIYIIKQTQTLMEHTLVVNKHNEDGEVIGHGIVTYTLHEQSNGEDNLDSVWIEVLDLDGCYPDTVRQAFKDEYVNEFIEAINLPE